MTRIENNLSDLIQEKNDEIKRLTADLHETKRDREKLVIKYDKLFDANTRLTAELMSEVTKKINRQETIANLMADNERLRAALEWFRFNSTPEGMARANEALQDKEHLGDSDG